MRKFWQNLFHYLKQVVKKVIETIHYLTKQKDEIHPVLC